MLFDPEAGATEKAAAEPPEPGQTLPLASNEDVMVARQAVRAAAVDVGFSLVEQTKIVTAASELARNCFVHGGGGTVRIEQVRNGVRQGIRLTVADQGPGIDDVEAALTDGYSTTRGLGYGLGGTRRLVDEFQLDSELGRGTTVTIIRWTAG